MRTQTARIEKFTDVNCWNHSSIDKKMWKIILLNGDQFDKYYTKKAAIVDAKKFNITIIK
jgi:hypothetical protein